LTEQLEAAGIGNYNNWPLNAGPSKVAAVNSPDDDGTTDIITNGDAVRQSFTLAASAIPPGSTINSLSVNCRAGAVWAAAGVSSSLRLGGTDLDGPINALPTDGTWQTFNDIIARPGGGAWSIADLATLEIGILSSNPGPVWIHATTLFVTVDYTPPAAGATGDMLLVF